MNYPMTLGEYIRHRRRRKKWGLQQLASATGLSLSHLSRIENDSAVPKFETVAKLAEALDGDLKRMLEMAKLLPQVILDRLVRRVASDTPTRRRNAGAKHDDPTFERSLIEGLDESVRQGLAKSFGLSQGEIEGLLPVLRQLAQMPAQQRQKFIDAIATLTKGSMN